MWMYGNTGLEARSSCVAFCGELRIAIGYAIPTVRRINTPTGRQSGPTKSIERMTAKPIAANVVISKSFAIEYCIGGGTERDESNCNSDSRRTTICRRTPTISQPERMTQRNSKAVDRGLGRIVLLIHNCSEIFLNLKEGRK